MSTINEQKCPACGAPVRFDPKRGKLVCDFCGAVSDIAAQPQSGGEADSALEALDFRSLSEHAVQADGQELPVYNCVSCGAELIATAEQAALTCPYCGNNIVLTEQVSGRLRPDGVIPFCIESAELPDAVRQFYRRKKLLPKGFFSEAAMGAVTGVYVPFWVFGGRLSGELFFNGYRSHERREGDYVVSETEQYHLVRDAEMAFSELPVDASGRIDDKLMDSLEPFDTAATKPFDMAYLAGFTADRFDKEKSDVAGRAHKRMNNTAVRLTEAEAAAGYQSVTRSGGSLQAELEAKYLLFPVYLFDIRHKKKSYPFAVNGQTGKVVGGLPIDRGACRRYFWARAGIVTGAVLLASVLAYLLGY